MRICNLRKCAKRDIAEPVHVPNYAKQQGNRTQAIAAGRRGARYNSAGKTLVKGNASSA